VSSELALASNATGCETVVEVSFAPNEAVGSVVSGVPGASRVASTP
jgi:hypothetical protein